MNKKEIIRLLQTSNLTAVGKACGLSRGYLSMIKNGKDVNLTENTLKKLSAHFQGDEKNGESV